VARILFHNGEFAASGRWVGEIIEPGPDGGQRGGECGALTELVGGEWALTGDTAEVQLGQRGLP
jgi:hypothetical protein